MSNTDQIAEPIVNDTEVPIQGDQQRAEQPSTQQTTGFGRGTGDRGRGGRGRGGGNRRGRFEEEKEWIPITKLGRLVKHNKIQSIEQVYLFSMPIKEVQIIDKLVPDLKDEVIKIMSVQKQTRAGQNTRFKAFVIVGDQNGHFGLGIKCSKEVANAIKGAIIVAKLNLIPIRRGYWGEKLGLPHTVPVKVYGRCSSVRARLTPAPKGTGIVAAPVIKKVLQFAGISDCYTNSRGNTRCMGNFVKAVFEALKQTYKFLTPDLWQKYELQPTLYQEHSDFLAKHEKKEL